MSTLSQRVTHCSILLLLILFISTMPLFAFNHPEIKWQTVTTRHFHIHYYDKTEPMVYAAWKIAEESYTAFDSLYQFDTRAGKIHLALADYDDYSNGFAAWTQRTIMVWVPDARFDLRGNTTWLRDVITHELGHIMSLDKKKGMQLLDWSVMLQYISPNVNVLYGEPLTFTTFFPMWFAEGTAQMRAQQNGSDCWDSRRDMLLRCATLNNKLLSLDEMGHFTHNNIGNEMVYNQGYAFTQYLEDRLGRENIAKIFNSTRGRRFFGTALDRYIKKTFDTPLEALFAQWQDSLKVMYKAKRPDAVSEVSVVWGKGTINAMPKISLDGKYQGWLTNHKDDFYRTDLVVAPVGTNTPLLRIKYAKTGWDFSRDGKSVFYIKARSPNKNGSFLNDIFSCTIQTGEEERLTHSARIYAVTSATNGKDLLCVQYKENAFAVVRYSLEKNTFTQVAEGVAGEPFLTIALHPSDESKCIVSKIVCGKAGLFTLDLKSGKYEPLANTEAQEESPFTAPNGRIYFSADYDGVFNIYSLLPDGSDLKRHTSVIGGAFSPVVDKKGVLLISEYTANGFRVGQVTGEGVTYEIPNSPVCFFEPLPVPRGKVKIKAHKYKPKLLRPSWEILTSLICTDMDRALQDRITEGALPDSSWGINLDFSAEIGMLRSDAVGQRDMFMGGAIVVSTSWQDDTHENDTNLFQSSLIPKNAHGFYSGKPGFQRRQDQKRYGRVTPAIRRDCAVAVQQDDDSTESEESPITLPFIVPYFGIENRSYTPTLGVNVAIALVSMIPAVFYIDPYIEWHAARDLYLGISPMLGIMPLYLFAGESAGFGMSMPFWAQWQFQRYRNEDISYNNAGISQLRVYIGPDITPYVIIEETDESSDSMSVLDTNLITVGALSFGVEFMHSFPLLKYGSFSISTANYGMKFSEKVSGTVGTIDSADYRFLITSATRTAFTFPVIRNINRGRLYADNLYGTLFYQLDFAGTDSYFENPVNDVFIDKEFYTNDASVSHWVGLGLELGLIKNHVFGRTLNVEAAWDVLNKEIAVNFAWWF